MSERELGVYLGHIVMAMDAIAEYIKCPLYRTAIAALPEYKRLESES